MSISLVESTNTAFIGFAGQGPVDVPTPVGGIREFEGLFGPVTPDSHLGYSVRDYFANGGLRAWIIRCEGDPIDAVSSLGAIDVLNLVVLPPYAGPGDLSTLDVEPDALAAVVAYAKRRGAIVIAGPPSGWISTRVALDAGGDDGLFLHDDNLAVYFPRICERDPAGQLLTIDPSGAVAGLIARRDVTRGPQTAPSGSDVALGGVDSLAVPIDAQVAAQLNRQGINCIRRMSAGNAVVWGARTRQPPGAEPGAWAFLPYRRAGRRHGEGGVLRAGRPRHDDFRRPGDRAAQGGSRLRRARTGRVRHRDDRPADRGGVDLRR